MFDQIQFIRVQGNDATEAQRYLERQRDADDLITDVIPPASTTYFIDGYVDTLPFFPVSDLVSDHYCYLQVFSIQHSSSRYYTRRSEADSYMLLYTYAGEGVLEYNDRQYHLKEGDGFFIDCRRPQYYHTLGQNWTHLDLHMSGPMTEPLYREYEKSGSAVFHDPIGQTLQDHLETLAGICSQPRPHRDLAVSSALYDILICLLDLAAGYMRKDQSMMETISELVSYMDTHYSEDLTLDSLSRRTGISKYHLSREFHQYTGFPPYEYILRLRIGHARTLLSDTALSIQQIAERVGISNPQHFSKLFHRICGMSPAVFRKQLKQNVHSK
jgi:AraC-like DNA-binding protein